MSELTRTLLSRHLAPCQFCGDIHPELKSGPCTFVEGDLYQAQVHCGHCGATGTRFAGEESLEEAEISAAEAWTRASTPKRGLRNMIGDTNKWVFTLALGALLAILWLPEDFQVEVLYGVLAGSFGLGILLGILEGRETYKREVAQWGRLRDSLRKAPGS